MAGTENASWWQYSKWVWNIYRSMLKNPPTNLEKAAVETFINNIWDVETKTGTRPWIDTFMNKRSVSQSTQYIGDPDVEPYHVDIEILGKMGRNLKETPMTDQEKIWCDALFAATGNRKLGIYP